MADDVAKFKELLLQYQQDPVLFIRQVMGVNPTDQQIKVLRAVAKPGSRVSVKSGHGTGKSAVASWLLLWHVSLFNDSKVACTAPTAHQLHDVLFAEVAKWRDRMVPYFRDALTVTSDEVYVSSNRKGQFAVARTARVESPEALQGIHAGHVLFLVDEASGVPDPIFEPLRGALSTAGARCLLLANPTRCDGFFYQTHHKMRDSWECIQLNGEESPNVGKVYIEEMRRDYGEDSDIYRVRVLGDFPKSSIDQLISPELVNTCANRHLREEEYRNAPVILGVDPAWMGDDSSVIVLRQGLMSRVLGSYRQMDQMTLADRVAGFETEYNAQAVFIDTGMGAGVIDRLRQLGRRPVPVNFGGKPINESRYHNKRAEMWELVKKWMESGGAIPDDKFLRQDLSCPTYSFTPVGKMLLESKKEIKARGHASPDRADALALTFAAPVRPRLPDELGRKIGKPAVTNSKWNPYRR